MGVGGLVPQPCGFVNEAVEHVKKAGGLYLSDEVQTGFGRTGGHYWGFEMLGTKPDMVSMAKQMGNGFPLAAVAMTKEVANCLAPKITFSTYGGNPIAMAAGREALKVIDDEKLQENSKNMGDIFLKGLNELKTKYKCIGDVRGTGMMIGMEMVNDRESNLDPMDPAKFANIFEKSKDYGILLGKGGRYGNVFRIQPPMCLNSGDVEFALHVIEKSIQES